MQSEGMNWIVQRGKNDEVLKISISLIFSTSEIEQHFAISNKRPIHIPDAFFSNEWARKSVNQWFINFSFQTIELKGQIAFGKKSDKNMA